MLTNKDATTALRALAPGVRRGLAWRCRSRVRASTAHQDRRAISDAHVIIATARRQRRNFVIDGIEVELFINPPMQNRRYFADGRGHDPHMFTFGCAIYDPHGAVAALQAEARRIWEAGPAPLEPRLHWLHRYFPADLLRDLDDIGDTDEATTTLLLAIVERLIATHHAIQRRWEVKPKRRLAELAARDPEAARLARLALAGATLAERRDAAHQLAAHVLAPRRYHAPRMAHRMGSGAAVVPLPHEPE